MDARRFEDKTDDRGFFKLGTTEDVTRLTAQTFFLEPIDTPVLFGAPRILAVQGALPFVRVDFEGSIQTRPHDQERVVYKVYSDTAAPAAMVLRSDQLDYLVPAARYLQLPANLDPRIAVLAKSVTAQAGARTGYDEARAIESHLRDNYQYSLDLKAGGPDPLSAFLFHVRSGHCAYFSTASSGKAPPCKRPRILRATTGRHWQLQLCRQMASPPSRILCRQTPGSDSIASPCPTT